MRVKPTYLCLLTAAVVATAALPSCSGATAPEATLRLAVTTSVKDSGLLEKLLPAFEAKAGVWIELAAVGSGKAIERLRDGLADAAVTHSPADEEAALAAGVASRRTPFMRNDFVVVGPAEAAAAVAGATSAADAFARIRASGRPFVSRGDGSGTNAAERALWAAAGLPAEHATVLVAGAGMGETLKRASTDAAFTLTDRATFLMGRKDLDLVILHQGDEAMRNVYSVLEPAAGKTPDAARAFVDFVRSAEGRALIGAFGVAEVGEALFTPID